MVFSDYDAILEREIWVKYLTRIYFIIIPPVTIFSPDSLGKRGGSCYRVYMVSPYHW